MNHIDTQGPPKRILLNIILTIFLLAIIIVHGFLLYYVIQQQLIEIIYLIVFSAIVTSVAVAFSIFFINRYITRYEASEHDKKLLDTRLTGIIERDNELNEKLAYEMQVLGLQNEKMTLLIELSDMVQACVSVSEATKAISIKCSKILHFSEGILYVMNPATNTLEAEVTWGDPAEYANTIKPDQCWALRKGGVYQVKNVQADLICEHVNPHTVMPYLCIPLMAQNAIFGMLHLDLTTENASISNENHILISAVAETLALAIANIKLRETLRNQSLHDSLTGLYNRRYIDEFLEKEIKLTWRTQSHLALLLIDIDFFKQFNDKYGHEAGDVVLQELGKFFQNEVRASDITCRYGGEEFLCVFHDCNLEDAKKRAEEMRVKIASIPIYYRNQKLDNITISLGIAVCPDDGLSATELFAAADKALYQAKRTDRNKVIAYSEMLAH